MLTTFSLWLLHVASYGIAYLLLAIEIIFMEVLENTEANTVVEKVQAALSGNRIILIILLALFLFSLFYSYSLRRWKNNCRIKLHVTKNATYETGLQLASNILPLVTIGYNTYVGLIVFLMIWLLGVAVVKGGYIHVCSIFLLNGYRLYTDDQGRYVLTKMKMEKYNLSIQDDLNGIEAFQIYKNVYIICDH